MRLQTQSIAGFLGFWWWSSLVTTGCSAFTLPCTRSTSSTSLASTIFFPTKPNIERKNTNARQWKFQGHDCFAETYRPLPSQSTNFFTKNDKPDVVLIHGFGCSTTYWRETQKAFTSEGYTVHALDLLGQGRSAKPGRAEGIEYSINLWARMVEEYAQQYIPRQNKVVLMGNSLGSVVALSAATGDHSPPSKSPLPSRVVGIGMYNCGVGMNSRNLLKDPNLNVLQRALFTFLFDTLDKLIFDNVPFLTYLLNDVVTRDLLRSALVGLYRCAPDPGARVDEALVDSFYLPAKDVGSVEALNQIYTNNAGKTPMEFHSEYAESLNKIPLHLVWGTEDQVTPLQGPVGQFYVDLAEKEDALVSFSTVTAGHIPFDEIPESNAYMIQFLNEAVAQNDRIPKSPLLNWAFQSL